MSELVGEFNALPLEHQAILKLAQEQHNIEIAPLQELVGGRTGAFLHLVSISPPGSQELEHLVLKLDRARPGKADELDKHRIALSQAPPDFARQHMAELAFEKVETEESLAIFYTIAGESLNRYRTLASHASQSQLEAIFSVATTGLLGEWNAAATFEQGVHPQDLLRRWLGRRVEPGGKIEQFLADGCGVNPNIGGLIVEGEVYPNPLVFARAMEPWGATRPIDCITGFQHGDLNVTNLLVKFTPEGNELEDYYLIDLALFQEGMPLLFDTCYLEMSYLLDYVPRVTLPIWIELATSFAGQDIPTPQQAPAELAGASAVIGAGRMAFDKWLQASHPTLSDDLWGQFWLAGVAAGLNFCNKQALPDQERLAGLIYAAAHLKRYMTQFGVPLPTEAADVYAPDRVDGMQLVYPSPARVTHNLPIPPTAYIGHEKEVASARDHLLRDDVNMLTLTGPGGVGKTRLSLEVGSSLLDDFEDGVFFVDLAPISAPGLVISTIAETLEVREGGNRPLEESLQDYLRDKRLLLLLDNFEQVLAAAPVVADLLSALPDLKVLVTSRAPLNLRAEHEFRVSPLALPDLQQAAGPEGLSQYEAVRLFINRAQAAKTDFAVTNENAPAVAEICYRLDGLPLAIELAAARIKLLSPDMILARLDDRLSLLTGGARDLPERQQTLRHTIDWSYELLDTGQQRLFALLSVFPSCTLEAVEVVANGIKHLDETGLDILDGLASLVDKSLIRRAEQGTGEARLLMLETIREYAAERLEEDAEFSAAARRAHAVYFADFTQRQWERLTGYGREAALGDIESDIDNVRTAWRYWVAEGNLEQLRKITDCLWLLYDARGWYHATVDLTADLLNVLASTPSTPERAQQEIMLQTSLARVLLAIEGYTPQVEKAYTRALELCEGQGEIPQLFPVLRALSSFYLSVADSEKGARMGEQILSLAERQDDARMRVEGHLVVGYNLVFEGSLSSGLDHLEKGIANYDLDQHRSHRFRLGNDPAVVCFTTSALVLWMLGFPDRALKRANDAVAQAYKLNHPFSMAYALFHTGLVHLWRREVEMAQGRAQAVLDIAEKHDFQIWGSVASCLHGAALAGMGWAEEGLMQINRGMVLYQELKTPPVFWPLLLSIQAATCGQAGRPEEGLTLLDEALEIVGPGSGDPEFYRLKGDLLLALSPENLAEAEPWFQQALEIAQERQARMLELRAAMSLSRLWREQGKAEHGRRMLSDAFERLTEGFTTADLKEARALLADLS